MSEEQQENSQSSQPSQSTQTPSQQANVDINEIVAKAKAEAKALVDAKDKEVEKRIADFEQKHKERIRAALGDSPEETDNVKLARKLLQDPAGMLAQAASLGAENAIETINKQKAQEQADAATVAKFTKEYPNVMNDYGEDVEAHFYRELTSGKGRQEAIEAALQKVIKKNKLKSLEEQRREGVYVDTTIPSVSGGSLGSGESSFNPEKDAADFIAARKEANRISQGKKVKEK